MRFLDTLSCTTVLYHYVMCTVLCHYVLYIVSTGNVYYPGFKRNFWLEFSSAPPETEAAPVSVTPATPRPRFLHPR